VVDAPHPGKLTLGRVFWDLLARGGVQGGVYLIDSLLQNDADPQAILRRLGCEAP
jgi:hypothetical protein